MTTFKELGMATTTKKSKPENNGGGRSSGSGNSSFDNGKISRAQERAYKDGILQMGQPASRRPQIMAKVLVWGSVALIVIFVIYNAIMANANRDLNSRLGETLTTQYNPSFKVRYADLGAEIINAWYGGKPSPVNVAEGIAWNSSVPATIPGSVAATPAAAAAAKGNSLVVTGVAFSGGSEVESPVAEGRFEERLRYYALVNGVPHIIGVSIAIPQLDNLNSVPTLIAAPAIISKATISPENTDKLVDPSKELTKANVPESALSAVDRWAKAWTEDDPTLLKSVTADPDPTNTYRGLGGGWSYVPSTAKVVWAVVSTKDPKNAVARVTWDMRTPNTTIPTPDGSVTPPQVIPGAVQSQTMDIIISNVNAGSPGVVAWGQAGTYPDLKALMNAIAADEAKNLAAPVAPVPGSDASVPAATTTPVPSAPATPTTDDSK
jgi:hypothetical protein